MGIRGWKSLKVAGWSVACVVILCGCGQGGGGGSMSPPPTAQIPPPPAPKTAGEIDTTFGEGGIRRLPFTNYASDARIDSKGRVLLASYSNYTTTDQTSAYFTRVLSDGTWDQSLVKVVPFGFLSYSNDARVFPLDAGGFIGLYAGSPAIAGTPTVVAQKFDDAGNVDPSYGSAGTVTLSAALYDVVGAPDGSVEVFTIAGLGLPVAPFAAVFRLDPHGQRDTAFEKNLGTVLAGCGVPASSLRAARLVDGRIAVALMTRTGDWCIAQMNTDGTADPHFGTLGRIVLTVPGGIGLYMSPLTVVPLPAGGLAIVMGFTAPVHNSPTQLWIFWINATGQVDAGRGGLRSYVVSGFPIGLARAAAVQSDGKVLVMGLPYEADTAFLVPNSANPRLVRLDSQGNVDMTFGADKSGFVTLDAGGNRLSPGRAIAVAPGVVYPSGSAAPSGVDQDLPGYFAVSVMKVYTGEP